MINKDVYSLDPVVAKKVELFIQLCAEAGYPILIVETMREYVTQLLYFIQGRIDNEDRKLNPGIDEELNMMRKRFKFWDLTPREIKTKITWTLDSKHFYGKAVDFVPFIKGKADWRAPLEYWQKCGEIAETLGFEWGGRWKQKDLPHIQYRG